MTAIDYAALVERLRGEQKLQQDEYGRGLHVLDEAADALERLTQPVGVEPMFLLFDLKDPSSPVFVEAETQDGIGVKIAAWAERADGLHELGPVHSDEVVARLIAERDAALTECARLNTGWQEANFARFTQQQEHGALQEQVNTLRVALNDATDLAIGHYGVDSRVAKMALEALAATEPKEKL